jgi:hypothetical protein
MRLMAGMRPISNKLNGIGPKHTDMLESIGIDSIKELSHRNAASLNAASLKEMIEERHGSVVGLCPGAELDRPGQGAAVTAALLKTDDAGASAPASFR